MAFSIANIIIARLSAWRIGPFSLLMPILPRHITWKHTIRWNFVVLLKWYAIHPEYPSHNGVILNFAKRGRIQSVKPYGTMGHDQHWVEQWLDASRQIIIPANLTYPQSGLVTYSWWRFLQKMLDIKWVWTLYFLGRYRWNPMTPYGVLSAMH